MLVAEDETQSVLTATENGYGKRTPIAEYTAPRPRHQGHDRHPDRASATARWSPPRWCAPDDEIMLITDRRRADPHPRRRDPRAGPRHAGRDA
ncbi:MAG: hypothetical protein MZV65_53035 [Chromatiales bacterium]|nr:hypothetical protein [Chromatiales bacterium]